jgi:hypothetical protein
MQEQTAKVAKKEGAPRALVIAIVVAGLLIGGALAVVAFRGEAMLLDLANAVWALCF